MADNKLLSKLSNQYRKNQGYSPAKRVKLSAFTKMARLKEYQAEETLLDMYVDYSDSETGVLYHIDSVGIEYVLEVDEIKKLFPAYVPYGNSYLLGTTFKCRIKAIDDSTGKVFLSAVECSLSAADYKTLSAKGVGSKNDAERLEKVLFEGLNMPGKQKPVVRGTVVKVEKERIFLDLYDTGVIGVVPVKNYAEQFRRDLRDIVYVGDSLKGVVFAYRARKGESEQHFLVSTADFLGDPWKKIKERFDVGDVIVIKCVEKPPVQQTTKKYFWGLSRVVPGIDIMSDYSTKMPRSAITVGHYYKCKIKEIDVVKQHFKVVPFAECSSYEAGMDQY